MTHSADFDDPPSPSKTQRKKQATALQSLGQTLAELRPDRLDAIPLSTVTRGAINEFRRMKTFEAKRRQMQRVGKLMRSEDEAAIRDAMTALDATDGEEQRRFRLAQSWRERLLAGGEAGMVAWRETYPHSDKNELAELLHQHITGDSQASSHIFTWLRQNVV